MTIRKQRLPKNEVNKFLLAIIFTVILAILALTNIPASTYQLAGWQEIGKNILYLVSIIVLTYVVIGIFVTILVLALKYYVDYIKNIAISIGAFLLIYTVIEY